MIFPYHVGAWEVLSELGLLTRDTPVAGASAGALVAAMHACDMSPADGRRVLMEVLADCRENGVMGRVGAVLEDALRCGLGAVRVRCDESHHTAERMGAGHATVIGTTSSTSTG